MVYNKKIRYVQIVCFYKIIIMVEMNKITMFINFSTVKYNITII